MAREPTPQSSATTPESDLRRVVEFFEQHGAWFTAALAVAAAGILGFRAYDWRRARLATAASEKFAAARTAQELEALVADYSSTPVAPLAALRLAKALYDHGRYQEALARYSEFQVRFPTHALAPAAELGRLHCLEAMGQTADAEQGFAAFASRYLRHFLRPQAVFGQGRCLEQMGRYREAQALYEDFIAEHPKSGWRSHAEEMLASVKEKLGEPGQPTPSVASPSGEAATAPARPPG